MKIHASEKHIFAFFLDKFTDICKKNKISEQLIINDSILLHRLLHIVRLSPEDRCIIFDRDTHAECIVKIITKKELVCQIESLEKNKIYTPDITVLVPLLKRDHMDELIYSLVEVGIQKINLIATEKSQRALTATEFERLNRVIIAASEQSKNFYFPLLSQIVPLTNALKQAQGEKILFDPHGVLLHTILCSSNSTNVTITLLIGPEGGLMQPEIELAQENNFTRCALTPTILRAQQAGALAAGIIRSWYR